MTYDDYTLWRNDEMRTESQKCMEDPHYFYLRYCTDANGNPVEWNQQDHWDFEKWKLIKGPTKDFHYPQEVKLMLLTRSYTAGTDSGNFIILKKTNNGRSLQREMAYTGGRRFYQRKTAINVLEEIQRLCPKESFKAAKIEGTVIRDAITKCDISRSVSGLGLAHSLVTRPARVAFNDRPKSNLFNDKGNFRFDRDDPFGGIY